MDVIIASLEVNLRDLLIDEYKTHSRENASLFTLSAAPQFAIKWSATVYD
jgi:hypothetical protein